VNFRGFRPETLSPQDLQELRDLARQCRGDCITMTTLAGCGHPGGSMSSIDFYLVLWHGSRLNLADPHDPERDRIVVSHGHTSPGVYITLASVGFVKRDDVIPHFRQAASAFEGHVERAVPGVEWSTGNLGQGLSAGCGMAVAGRLLGKAYHVFVAMSDGEQQKGQVAEARRFAVKYGFTNITGIIDLNERQISGRTSDVMPQDIAANYRSDGWAVLDVDGHDFQAIYQALRQALHTTDRPTVILARTVMGKGVRFMEGDEQWHGKSLPEADAAKALAELGVENEIAKYGKLRAQGSGPRYHVPPPPVGWPNLDAGQPILYEKDTDERSAFGRALEDLAKRNLNQPGRTPIAVFDCDLASSVRTHWFTKVAPGNFFQGGVQEHNTAVIAAAASISGIVSVFADFGVFGIDEDYNQQRLAAINEANLKLVTTHCGLDVGEDGKTHQCIDYVGATRNFFGWKLIVPSDPNQADHATRYFAAHPGNIYFACGRSPHPVVRSEDGGLFYGAGYEFEYGKADLLRPGDDGAIITMGSVTSMALAAHDKLKEVGLRIRVLAMPTPLEPDREAIRAAAKTGLIVTYEDHSVHTGLGCIVANVLAEEGLTCKFRKLGVSFYSSSGIPEALWHLQGLDVDSLVDAVQALCR
jgi:transketolase